MREQAASALTRLRWETKLHSMKRSGVVGVRERSSQGKEIKNEDATYNDWKNGAPELHQASSMKQGARDHYDEARRTGDS
jgi:hypothetical protein